MGQKIVCVAVAFVFGCGGEQVAKEIFDFAETIAVGKADPWNQAEIVEGAGPCERISGPLDAAGQVQGLTVEVLSGETLDVDVSAWSGPDSADRPPGELLDTVVAVYGPRSGDRPGPLLGYADDDGDCLQAVLEPVEVTADGLYLVVMTSWDDPGQGRFELAVSVEGADCER